MENFTSAQREAIFCDASEILVSAAAGSGKTAVLTERIVRHISEGISIDRLLVVTFTEAASAEMRERIEAKLLGDERLSHHAAMLPMADISTIHSFCRKLIKENFQLIDIDPAFRIGDDAELELVKSQVMDELFESEYSREGNEDFLDLADVYGGKTSDGRLDALVRKIYGFMASDPFPMEAARRYAADFNNLRDLDETPWMEIAKKELSLGLNDAVKALERAIKICNAPAGPIKYAEKLYDEKEMLQGLADNVLCESFENMYMAFKSVEWGTLPRITAKDEVDGALKERVQRIRNKAVKERVKGLEKGVFFAPPEKMLSDLKALAPRVNALMRLAQNFSEAYAAEKRVRNIMDFSDLEHFAIRILYPEGPEDMTPSPPEQKYHEVLIDEYQDSNEIQDLILSAVAERRFMVGDVKQSIYRFRRANPTLFLAKYEKFQEKSDAGFRIDLSHNFRSRPEVLNAVNFFFSRLMSRELGDVVYDHSAALHAGLSEYAPTDEPFMQIEILDQHEEGDVSEEESPSNIIAETRVLAKCIKEVMKTREGLKFGDIAILTRSFSGIAGEVIEELKNHGIDAIADLNEGFFEQQEIKTALAFLRVIDNPLQDIELITVLCSPVYAFTADELFEISQNTPEATFYERLKAYYQNINCDKIRKFLNDLSEWRSAAAQLPISRLIGLIYDCSDYPSHVANMSGGMIRQANLRLLLEKAIEFEATNQKGLFHFIRYIERLGEAGTLASAVEPTTDYSDKVRIMTIHKSKGLEFPVVICAFLAKKFNTDDERQPVVLHSAKGIGPYYIDTALRTRANTLARFGLTRLTRRENLSEELRCLYVAMTRAKDLLILTGRVNDYEKSAEKWSDNLGVSSYLDWIMPCVLSEQEEAAKIFKMRVHKPSEFESPIKENIPKEHIPKEHIPPTPLQNILTLNPAFPLPSKLSISEIKRLYDITPDSSFREDFSPAFSPPAFFKEASEITPMQMGSAIHTITEHIDYAEHKSETTINELIDSLVEKNLLSLEEANSVERGKIKKLANSPLAARLRNAAASFKLYRETPFVLALSASRLYPEMENNETILVHGIIDCHFEEDGKIILLDFKSDKIPHSTALDKWAEKHRVQLEIYKEALEKSTDMEVSEVLLYSFSRGESVELGR
ncbi:MAG: helicase-exonuclease AddAB subunit AddA [Defluviitaleaceae bacterium]|nr:helicase-exonuclease AddAB subunit AddA [Defluviitaleaceae bacterium]